MHPQSHIPALPRPAASASARPASRWSGGPLRAGAGCLALALVCVTVLVLGLTPQSGADRVRARPQGPAGIAAKPVLLPGGVRAFLHDGVLYAPPRYAPPGIWVGPAGPGPIR